MTSPEPDTLESRLERVEQQLRDLRNRLAVIERTLDPRVEHAVDRSVVRDKVTYDWQS